MILFSEDSFLTMFLLVKYVIYYFINMRMRIGKYTVPFLQPNLPLIHFFNFFYKSEIDTVG